MSAPTPADVRRWSEEVARDPASLAFLPLAAAYRGQGRGPAAVRLLLRGLERHPENVEAHHLLGLLLREQGEPVRAFDEWDIALRLDPEHRPSRREIGLLCLERGEWAAAARHLERAASAGPDREVEAGLERARRALGRGGEVAPSPSTSPDASRPTRSTGDAPASAPPASSPPTSTDDASVSPDPSAAAPTGEPASVQDELARLAAERGIAGALLMDGSGLVVAGEMRVGGRDRGAEVAATLTGASAEAERVLRHLELGAWKGILLETPEATVRLAPAAGGDMVAVAAERSAPTGWVLRVAARAQAAAARARPEEGAG